MKPSPSKPISKPISKSFSKPIYVERKIDTSMEKLWHATQHPDQHQQWDLRFSEISYLPKEQQSDPQQFDYRTKIGFGLQIAGKGESIQTIQDASQRTSSLKFWSDQPISLIRSGSGYWQYVQEEDGIRFLTQYQYETRFGKAGQWLDRFLFNPLMSWATAWSFDCLRLWLEKGMAPKWSIQRMLVHVICVCALAFAWIYQGLVPKLLVPDSGELDILRGSGLFNGYESLVLQVVGWGEIGLGVLMFLLARKKATYVGTIVLLLLLTLGAAFSAPSSFVAPFNPVTLNLLMMVVAVTGLLQLQDLPSASNCKRRKRL
ncbi:DoxX-like family protein [Marinicrinis sediminis]|uniref:DoxX-like family protein n=1 Tax=Marinicrinis sediminis TaxID=1652465 RepID=A0ABW5RDG0_9BACL